MAMTHEVYADHLGCTVSTFGKYGLPVTITTLFAKRDKTVMMMKEREKKNEDREINWGERFFFRNGVSIVDLYTSLMVDAVEFSTIPLVLYVCWCHFMTPLRNLTTGLKRFSKSLCVQ